jgi:hypothetical protein
MSRNWHGYQNIKTPQPDMWIVAGYAEGAGAADMSIIVGEGVSLIDYQSSAGLFTFTFDRTFATLVSWWFDFAADTAANVKGFDCTPDLDSLSLTAPNADINVAITNGSATLENLDANEFLSFGFVFSTTTRTR